MEFDGFERKNHLHLLATEVIRQSDRLDGGEGMGWGLDDKYAMGGGSGREGVGTAILNACGCGDLVWFQALEQEEQDRMIDYAHKLYEEVGGYIREQWAGIRNEGEARLKQRKALAEFLKEAEDGGV
mgnify:CR=1 FL=1